MLTASERKKIAMTIQNMLARAQDSLSQGDPKEAQALFLTIWQHGRASLDEKYSALKGFCAALDAQGDYYRAETEMMDGLRALARKRQQLRLEESRQAALEKTLLWGGVGIIAGTVLASVFSDSRAA
jgi:hypothetical protein